MPLTLTPSSGRILQIHVSTSRGSLRLNTTVGTIVRINQRTATVDPGDGTSWRSASHCFATSSTSERTPPSSRGRPGNAYPWCAGARGASQDGRTGPSRSDGTHRLPGARRAAAHPEAQGQRQAVRLAAPRKSNAPQPYEFGVKVSLAALPRKLHGLGKSTQQVNPRDMNACPHSDSPILIFSAECQHGDP
jgi:hypothetical protein